MKLKNSILLLATLVTGGAVSFTASAKDIKLLNVSYDPTRELYREFNVAFAREWQKKTGDTVTIQQSHGGSGKQGRAVIDGLPGTAADLSKAFDLDPEVTAWTKSQPEKAATTIRIAAASARFNVAFVKVGLSGCDIGTSWMLPRLVGASRAFGRAADLLLERIEAGIA